MDVEKVSITATSADGKPVEVVMREGDAPKINEPVKFSRKVCLGSIAEWVSKKKFAQAIEDRTGVVVFCQDPENPSVSFYENPNNVLATILDCYLNDNPDFNAFGINKEKIFTQKELERHTRKYAHCFENVEDAKSLINSLTNFEVRFEQVVSKSDDRSGNKENLDKEMLKLAKGELPKTLKLRMPLFKNTDPVSFEISVEVDRLNNNMPGFSFYSMDVELMKRNLATSLIKKEVEGLRSNFPCLEV